MKGKFSLLTLAVALGVSGAVMAKDTSNSTPSVSAKFSGSHVSFVANGMAGKSSLSITGPNGFAVNKSVESGLPSVDLQSEVRSKGTQLKDGVYKYEVLTQSGDFELIADTMDNGRGENNAHYANKGVRTSGIFRVVGGQIKQFEDIKESKAF